MLTPAIQLVKCDFGAGLPSTPSTPIKMPAKMTARDEIGGTLRDPNSYLLIICPRFGRLFVRQRPPMTRPNGRCRIVGVMHSKRPDPVEATVGIAPNLPFVARQERSDRLLLKPSIRFALWEIDQPSNKTGIFLHPTECRLGSRAVMLCLIRRFPLGQQKPTSAKQSPPAVWDRTG
jgi:hypothetical protein